MTDKKFKVHSQNPDLITIQTTVPAGYEATVAMVVRDHDAPLLAASGHLLEACVEALAILRRTWLDPVSDAKKVNSVLLLLEKAISKAGGKEHA